jgi:hypothetical protein
MVAMRVAALRNLSLILVCFAAVAQEGRSPSPEVDKSLRDRVAQFMQFTVDHRYSKAYELVAEETRDWYLSSGKPQYTKFSIESIEYSSDFQQATVKTKVTRVLSMNGRELPTELVIPDLWKMDDGKWMWTHDPDVLVTPFGEFKKPHFDASAPSSASALPKDLSPEAAVKASTGLKVDVSTNKKELLFEEGKTGDQEIVFHNGMPGNVVVNADIVGDYRAFSVTPASTELQSGKDLVLKISYKPSPNPVPASLRLGVDPLNRNLIVSLKFRGAAAVSR